MILTPALEEEVAGRFLEALAPLEKAGQLGALLLQMTPGFAPRAADLTALEPLLRQLKGHGNIPAGWCSNYGITTGSMSGTLRKPRHS